MASREATECNSPLVCSLVISFQIDGLVSDPSLAAGCHALRDFTGRHRPGESLPSLLPYYSTRAIDLPQVMQPLSRCRVDQRLGCINRTVECLEGLDAPMKSPGKSVAPQSEQAKIKTALARSSHRQQGLSDYRVYIDTVP